MAAIWHPVYECVSCGGDAFGSDKCSSCIRAEEEDQKIKEERHPCAAIGCTNTVPFSDEPRCYSHTKW